MFSAATALSTCATDGFPANVTVNSVPPAKSMPSKKPLLTIEMMPGMMINSETAKNTFRRPMMFSRRTLGSGRGSGTGSSFGLTSGTMSAVCSVALTSDRSGTVYSHQHRPAEGAAGHDDRQQVVRHHDR